MKKVLFVMLLAATFAACNDDDKSTIRYATANNAIENGSLTGANIHFLGTITVTDARNKTFSDKEAWFEFAGGSGDFALYMHKVRFAADMQPTEMRLYEVPYTPISDKALRFSGEKITPETLKANEVGGGASYQPAEGYAITALEGSIEGLNCRISFTCTDTYRIIYEGRLIIR